MVAEATVRRPTNLSWSFAPWDRYSSRNPVYCVAFNRTGHFFVTGADNHLVKLFSLLDAGGAVVVATFCGHADVVTDVDVDHDNGVLAMASKDGSWATREAPTWWTGFRQHPFRCSLAAWTG